MTDGQFPIILFDPECMLCLRFKQGLSLLNNNLVFISARDDEIYARFPELDRQECLDKVHLIKGPGDFISGPEVVDYLVATLPGVSKLGWLLETNQGQKVKNFFLEKVEELRDLSTKKKDCPGCPRE